MITFLANIIARGEENLQVLIGAVSLTISVDEVRIFIIPIYAIKTSYIIFERFQITFLNALYRVKLGIFFCCAFVIWNRLFRIVYFICFIINCPYYNSFDQIWIIFLLILLCDRIDSIKLEREFEIDFTEVEWVRLVVFHTDGVCRNDRVLAL